MTTPLRLKKESDKTGWTGLSLVDSDGLSIANMVMDLRDRERANAALIVKAVNSYEAMKEALAELIDEIEICKEYGSLTDKHYITGDPLTTAKKALALAEGA